jgi:spore coat protein U-like protein
MSLTSRHLARIFGLLIVLAAGAGLDAGRSPARALGVLTCSFSMTNVAFGNVDVLPGAAFATSAPLTIACSGLSILPTTVFVCVAFPATPTMLGPSSSTLRYNLLGPPPAMTPWSNTTAIAVPVSGSILGFTANATVTVAASLLANQQSAAPGLYQQTVSATVTYSTTTCTTGLIVGSGSVSFLASATVLKSCNVAASNLAFGVTGDLTAAIAGQSNINVQCSNGTGYSIALNGGLSGATNPTQRKMNLGAGNIVYGLYQNLGHTSPWGGTIGTNVVNGIGTSVSQAVPVYGLVPIQTTPPVGTYSDTIVVSVTY